MKTEDVHKLEEASQWALSDAAPPEAKVLLGELSRRVKDYSGNTGWLYEEPFR
jgi:hypothetical protein